MAEPTTRSFFESYVVKPGAQGVKGAIKAGSQAASLPKARQSYLKVFKPNQGIKKAKITVDDLTTAANPGLKTKGNARLYEFKGGALEHFESLNLKNIKDVPLFDY